MSTLEMMFMSGNPAVVIFAFCSVAIVVLATLAITILLVILIRVMVECW